MTARTPAKLALALGVALCVAHGAAMSAHGAERPNFVFIMSDDHAYQAVGAYGSRLNETPNIDRIANAGVRFDRCYVANSICAPSRACILTGKHSHANGVLDNSARFDGGQWTFPKALQNAGYQTALVGKWHLKSDPTGFDHWDVLPGQGRYYRPIFRTADGRREEEGYVTDVTTELALQWLRGEGASARDPAQPFLLMLHHKAPHRPWDPGPEHIAAFHERDLTEPPTLFDDYATRASAAASAEMRITQMDLARDLKVWREDDERRERLYSLMAPETRRLWERHIDPRFARFQSADPTGRERVRWMWRRYMEDYLACVQSVDDSVGRVLDWLDQAGLAENAVVIYTSDQGFYLGEHGWFDKRFMYEQSLRTPMVLRWPAGVARAGAAGGGPRVEERIVSNIDVAPTLLEIAGAASDPAVHGRSFAPLIKGEAPDDWRQLFYYHYYEGPDAVHTVARHDGVTDGALKLIHFYELGEWELYDLESDPLEVHNRYDDPAYADERERMTGALLSRRAELGVSVGE